MNKNNDLQHIKVKIADSQQSNLEVLSPTTQTSFNLRTWTTSKPTRQVNKEITKSTLPVFNLSCKVSPD